MDFTNLSQDDQVEQQESHWQPALRPNDTDTSQADASTADHQDQTGINSTTAHSSEQASRPQNVSHFSFSHNEEDELEEPAGPGRLDPSWGIKRTDSAHLLDTVHRSPSFPPPQTEVMQPQHSAQSPELDPMYSQTQLELQEEQEPLPSAADAYDDIPMSAIDQADTSRYDEGIPLISPEPRAEMALAESELLTESSLENVGDEQEQSFANQMPYDQQEPRPALERKETEEVLDGLHFETSAPDSPPLPPIPEIEQDPRPVSEEKDLSAVFGDSADDELAAAFAQTSINDDDPWKAAMGDQDDFLIDDADDLLPDSDEEPEKQPQQQMPPTRPQRSSTSRSNTNPYAPHQPTTAEMSQFGSTAQNIGFGRQPVHAFQPPQQPPNITTRAASFVDQSKGGYKSPYDLPMDLAPKKRVQANRAAPLSNVMPPPPRSSSINGDKQLQSPFSPNAATFSQPPTPLPTGATSTPQAGLTPNVPPRPAANAAKRQGSGFFEELPVAPRTRAIPAPRAPIQQTPAGPPRQTSFTNTNLVNSPPQVHQPQQPQQTDPYAQFQLRPPEKLDPYANVPSQPVHPTLSPALPPTAANPRYSPAPPATLNGVKPSPSPRYSPAPPPVAGPRYSPAPPPQASRYVSQPLPSTNLLHQPRTSSPLAQHRRSVDEANEQPIRPLLPHHATSTSLPYAVDTVSPQPGPDPVKQEIMPPRRSQTQSPGRQMARSAVPPRIAPPPVRPASAYGQLSPTRTQAPANVLSPPRQVQVSHFTEHIDYIRPNDETANDPLERWKGAPIFRFGFGGSVLTSFPRHTPRYNAASTRPQIKATAGEVNIRRSGTVLAQSESIAKFPGPLRGKAKKKDVLVWLTAAISNFETESTSSPSKRLEEKIALWKIVKVLTEQDGHLDSTQAVQAISAILMPDVYSFEDTTPADGQLRGLASGIYQPATFNAKSEVVDPQAVEKLRRTLLKGRREDAVWQAVDSHLWSHALILASTLGPAIWKQVVAEFVRQEVRTIGSGADSLCAFYQVLGGNLEESVDQLVPPSARAGLQMVSTMDHTGPTRNALAGLDRWKETICLMLNNRSNEDQRAMITLARLLSDYGRIEAAHICYLLGRNPALPALFGGLDDPNTMIVLLGADHGHQASTFHRDNDAIMLTEVYEFVTTTLATGTNGAPMPHLAAYKLSRAEELADLGLKTEAQAYCDAIASGLKSSTKHSLYYNPLLLGEVEDLSNRLKQVPVSSASWMAKPSVEKVTGSLLSKFSSFVTGDDSDAESKGSARDAAEVGPFANVSGSPSLSRSASQTDLYGSYPTQVQMTPSVAATAAGSRYAPNGMNSTRSSSEMVRGRPSGEFARSPPSTSHSNHGSVNMFATMAPTGRENPYASTPMSPPTGVTYSPYQPSGESYMPSVEEETMPPSQSLSYTPEIAATNGYQPSPSFGGYSPLEPAFQPQQQQQQQQEPELVQAVSNPGFEPSSYNTGYGYAPPEDTGYVPYQPEPDSDEDKPKKTTFMNEDDHDYSRNAAQAPAVGGDQAADNARKKANDEAAEAAFRAAAEDDARRAKEQASQKKASGSWLGGWFGGTKKPDSLDASPPAKGGDQKVHRVHLGESKMKLYYDKDKKKWINPDNPDAAEKKTAPPPPRSSTGSAPPMGGPPRSVSTPHSLPAGGISRSGTPTSVAVDTGSEGGDSRPGTSGAPSGFAATLPPGTQQSLGLGNSSSPASTSGPPSRPPSALSSASGLDDLLGGPPTAGSRKVSGRAAKGKKGRYVDVMAQ